MKRIRSKSEQERFLKDRRQFLTRASLILAGMGLAPSVKVDLLWKLGKKAGFSGSSLLANEIFSSRGQKHFVIEYALRAGTGLDASIAPFAAHLDERRTLGTCSGAAAGTVLGRLAPRHLPSEQITLPSDIPGNAAYLTPWAASLEPLLNRADRRTNLAYTFSLRVTDGHTSNHSVVRGGTNGGMSGGGAGPNPSAFLAGVYGNTIIPGVFWRNEVDVQVHRGGATTAPASGQTGDAVGALTEITGGTNQSMYRGVNLSTAAQNFLSNFTPAAIPLSADQNILLASTIKGFNESFANGQKIQDANGLIGMAERGARNVTVDLRSELLPTSSTVQSIMPDAMNRFEFNVNNLGGQNLQNRVGEATYFALMAMANGGLRSAAIAANTGDWHGFYNGTPITGARNQRSQARPSLYGTHFANIVAATYELAAQLPNPFSTSGETIADHLTIIFRSEFGRGSTVNGGDGSNAEANLCGGNNNDDGLRQFMLIFSPNVNQGAFGDVDIVTGSMFSFNTQTGATTQSTQGVPIDSMYKTICAAIGIPGEQVSRYVSTGQAIPSWLKS